MADLLCPKCDGVTVDHIMELLAENDRLRARIASWLREFGAHDGHLSSETLMEMFVASRARESTLSYSADPPKIQNEGER